MAERLYRAQLLLEPEQHETLRLLAEKENRSLSDVAREALRLGLEAYARRNQRIQRTQLLQLMSTEREALRAEIGTIPRECLEAAREERAAQLEAVWRADDRS